MKTICCVAGRSGGHIIPCLSYAQTVRSADQTIVLFTSNTKLDQSITNSVKEIECQIPLPLENIPYKNWLRFPLFAWRLFKSILLSFYYLIKYRPSVIISTGGYIAVPVCLVGKLLRIRVELFELNVVPGKAVKFLTQFASVTKICFSETEQLLKKGNCQLSAYPLKVAYTKAVLDRIQVLEPLGLSPDKKTILILGGSQGSQSLNELFLKAIKNKAAHSWQVIHQVGNNDPEPLRKIYQEYGITARLFQFHNHLEQLYCAADLIICRSGAGTLFETLHFKKRCVTIPLEAATTTHQLDNAKSFAKQYPQLFAVLRQNEVEQNPMLLYNLVASLSSG